MGDIGIARTFFEEGTTSDERRKGGGGGTEGATGSTDPAVAFFFVTYALINSIMMMNVVVAVLCDEFMQQVQRGKDEEERLLHIEMEKRKVKGVLDPMTIGLITFEDEADLENKIRATYEELDEDGSGGLCFEEVLLSHASMRAHKTSRRMHEGEMMRDGSVAGVLL